MRYACKLCIWHEQLWGDRFRPPEDWFENEDDFLKHILATHPESSWVSKEKPSWAGILEDAQACAEGYLICWHSFEPEVFSLTCYRCNATTTNLNDLNLRYCVSCGRQYKNYYSPSKWDKPSGPDPTHTFDI